MLDFSWRKVKWYNIHTYTHSLTTHQSLRVAKENQFRFQCVLWKKNLKKKNYFIRVKKIGETSRIAVAAAEEEEVEGKKKYLEFRKVLYAPHFTLKNCSRRCKFDFFFCSHSISLPFHIHYTSFFGERSNSVYCAV